MPWDAKNGLFCYQKAYPSAPIWARVTAEAARFSFRIGARSSKSKYSK
jgi:hypothetical protein